MGADREGADHGLAHQSGEEGELTFPIIDSLASLTWLVNLAALELHVHQWTVTKQGRPRNPNRLVVDLDPGEPAGLGSALRSRCWSATGSSRTGWSASR